MVPRPSSDRCDHHWAGPGHLPDLLGPFSYFNSRMLFAAYVAVLTTTSLGDIYTRPRWRRLWLGYSLFGWAYLLLVLRGGFGFTPDVYAENLSRFCVLGLLMGFICALIAHLLTGLQERGEHDEGGPSAGRS